MILCLNIVEQNVSKLTDVTETPGAECIDDSDISDDSLKVCYQVIILWVLYIAADVYQSCIKMAALALLEELADGPVRREEVCRDNGEFYIISYWLIMKLITNIELII